MPSLPRRHRSLTRWLDDQVLYLSYGPVPRPARQSRMTTEPGPAEVFDTGRRATGLILGGAGPVALAAALVPLRASMSHTNAALLLVVVVVAAALVGGRSAAVLAAGAAALSFDFFLTRPYYQVAIESADDIETTIILAAVGLIVGQLVVSSARHHYTAHRRRHELEALERVIAASTSTDTDEIVAAVREELTDLLHLRECRWRPGYHGRIGAVLTKRGTFRATAPREEQTEAFLPRTLEIPVHGSGNELGRLVLATDPSTPVSVEERLVSLAIADILGTTLTRRHDSTEP